MRTHYLRPMTASTLAHLVLILVLSLLRFPAAVRDVSPQSRHITLIAPSAGMAPRPVPKLRAPARTFLPLLPPPAHPEPRLAVELPPAPVLEAPRPSLPAAELPRTIPPPPLKTDNLAEARVLVPSPVSKVAVKAAGFSSIETSSQGPPRGTLSATGAFDSVAPVERAPARATAVVSGGFGDVVVATQAAAARKPPPPILTPVEIVSKPRPIYTEEARRLQIEGEVLVEVLFAASGEARIVRVLRGLGHGLDETAMAAARGIHFRPARRDGVSTDSSAVVHIVFQLAY